MATKSSCRCPSIPCTTPSLCMTRTSCPSSEHDDTTAGRLGGFTTWQSRETALTSFSRFTIGFSLAVTVR